MKTVFSSIQWVVFILAGSLVAPLAAGHALGLPPEDISSMMQRTFLLIGISGLLQTMFGHRLPLMENPAGLWWGFSPFMQDSLFPVLLALRRAFSNWKWGCL
ncbi:purine/pyrimidine permease [Paenibacillus larvae]|nr:purine/pyrimidine permease [Paenibacillus larvae]MDT2242861.1 purine/pyrimidine permease [Paenibacillus larvae]MDT2255828.1 purine/pyrimidine permease [Paenibacillus larvae]MDT2261575.1 purine/pyrimidine permease [Paenibacillus larvae]MDT2265385.1 purine/pyrimidine permease [Paenibacillus larvae]MDT2288856.1 purine/pyrimidine permease [Paenibacillus larvae]